MMTRLALVQMNALVGDLPGNARKIQAGLAAARSCGAALAVFPELALTGYPPEDLLLKAAFVEDNLQALAALAPATAGLTAVVGFVDRAGDRLLNAAAVLHDGSLAAVVHKMFLPNYGVFDEPRYFTPGGEVRVFDLGAFTFGVCICEDLWVEGGPYQAMAAAGAQLVVNINASPYHMGKWQEREALVVRRAKELGVYCAYVNLVGGQDELVFDGHSLAADSRGRIVARGQSMAEDVVVVNLDFPAPPVRRTLPSGRGDGEESASLVIVSTLVPLPSLAASAVPALQAPVADPPGEVEEIYRALVLGTRDYVEKNGFKDAVIGLSGGVDSALTAAIAVDALGSDRVTGLFMPSVITSTESREDAAGVAAALGIRLLTVSIPPAVDAFRGMLAPVFTGRAEDATEENLQARVRGDILMAFSNKFGSLVFTTGNKSEMACGYCTLYGDMAGGFAVIKDVPKTLVYRLADYRNGRSPVIPPRVLSKPPSAELRPNQKDTDSLPPYGVLDPILEQYVEQDLPVEAIIRAGFDSATVRRVVRMVDRSEYKRRQAPPGVKITPKAFGRDRRLPITNGYAE